MLPKDRLRTVPAGTAVDSVGGGGAGGAEIVQGPLRTGRMPAGGHGRTAPPRVRPRYLTAADGPWLRALLDEYERFVGMRRGDLASRLREPLAVPCAPERLAQARYVLDRLTGSHVRAEAPPARTREVVFLEAARGGPRAEVLGRAAHVLRVDASAIDECLFADLPDERRLGEVPPELGPDELALRVNLALVQGLLAQATVVRVWARGGVRDLVRHAQLRGLLCVVRAEQRALRGGVDAVGRNPSADSDSTRNTTLPPGSALAGGATLEVSGPLALFRRTRMYGRALGELVPRLAWCERFCMEAECMLGEGTRIVEVRTGDPIRPVREPRRFDSKVERRFAKDFARAAPDWEIIREPRAISALGTLIFPDFAIVHRRDVRRQWLVEILGFWTTEYVETKLGRLGAASLSRFILCVDESRRCDTGGLPPGIRVVPYKRRVGVQAVLQIIDGPEAS